MSTDFPFVEIPEELYPVLGTPDPGTRIYRRDGSQEESAAWYDLLHEVIGASVSPGGVQMICPASRAAVYKRMKEGKLSAFLFHVTYRKTTLFGQNKILRQSPYVYVPVSEARAWREELEERAIRQGIITEEEMEGAKPDWHGDFLNWRNKRERSSGLNDLKRDGITVFDLIKGLGAALLPEKDSTTIFPQRRSKKQQQGTEDRK